MAVIRTRQTRMPHGVRDTRGTVAKTDDATLTETELLHYGACSQAGTGKTSHSRLCLGSFVQRQKCLFTTMANYYD